MATVAVNDKLSEVLKIFISPDYNVASKTYLDLLLSHITTQMVSCDDQNNESHDLLKNWVLEALELWNNGKKPNQAVIVFTIKLIGIIGRKINDFNEWEREGVFDKLLNIFNLRNDDIPASVKMAYTSMLLEIITHENGRKWVINSGVWKDIVKFSQLNQTMYVTRESHKFICDLLIKETLNTKFCHEIISLICEPIINHTSEVQIHKALEDLYLDQTKVLCTTLDLITNIFENTVFLSLDNTIPDLIENLINLEDRVKALFEACISTRFLQFVHKLWILILFSKLKLGLKENSETVDAEYFEKLINTLAFIHSILLSKKYVIESTKTSKLALIYWKKLQGLQPFKKSTPLKFEHQGIALMIIPMFVGFRQNSSHHEFKDMFVDKIFSLTTQSVQRLVYHTRDVILKSDIPIEPIVKHSIDMILDIVDILDRDVAVITFQSMCHLLKNYTPIENPEEASKFNNHETNDHHQRKLWRKSFLAGDPIVEHPTLLSTLLHGLAVMTEKFQFKWPDCVETICVLSLAKEILDHSGTLPHICVKALRLSKLAIENFMPPNLALLVASESHSDSIESTLFKRLHDPNWEVRDSVLEVLNTMATISEAKYPSFQDLLLTNNFIPIINDIAMTDGETYVRASALIFIATTVRINKLWDQELSKLNLPQKIIKLFNEESEAIVRRETVNLIKELYVHRKWPKSIIDTMCNAMTQAAIMDLHWEVKVYALEYWRYLIQSHFTDQGMLDGEFPSMTFSKEHRKIVTLNESEIKRRLNKALDEMAKQNCLGVLLATLDDESDFEVSKSAANIINNLKKFLLKYKLDEPMPEQNIAPKDSAIIDTSYVKLESEPSEPEVNLSMNEKSGIIDDIVDTDDTNLLASIYQNTMKVNDDNTNKKSESLIRVSNIKRQEFLNRILNTDIDKYIEERRRWLSNYTISFDSVLDDILTTHNQTGINSMDCY
ncbi:hypothetical protein PV326_009078 [Microctonus aethiopoides]|nr:hypothetical protein PV326_009078 [Microctonus aethiopoides]